MRLPTPNHIFFIPVVLAIGAIFGYWWGRRSLRIHLAEQERAHRQALRGAQQNNHKLEDANDGMDASAPED